MTQSTEVKDPFAMVWCLSLGVVLLMLWLLATSSAFPYLTDQQRKACSSMILLTQGAPTFNTKSGTETLPFMCYSDGKLSVPSASTQ